MQPKSSTQPLWRRSATARLQQLQRPRPVERSRRVQRSSPVPRNLFDTGSRPAPDPRWRFRFRVFRSSPRTSFSCPRSGAAVGIAVRRPRCCRFVDRRPLPCSTVPVGVPVSSRVLLGAKRAFRVICPSSVRDVRRSEGPRTCGVHVYGGLSASALAPISVEPRHLCEPEEARSFRSASRFSDLPDCRRFIPPLFTSRTRLIFFERSLKLPTVHNGLISRCSHLRGRKFEREPGIFWVGLAIFRLGLTFPDENPSAFRQRFEAMMVSRDLFSGGPGRCLPKPSADSSGCFAGLPTVTVLHPQSKQVLVRQPVRLMTARALNWHLAPSRL